MGRNAWNGAEVGVARITRYRITHYPAVCASIQLHNPLTYERGPMLDVNDTLSSTIL
jgi:hypothetical protein